MKKYLVLSLLCLFTAANMHGEFPLHTAVRENNMTEVKRLIASGADVNEKDYTGYTPLHWSANADFLRAASADCLTIAQLLVDAGADVNAHDYYGENTPLDGAAFWGHEEMIKLLLNAGADVTLKNKAGYTALDEAEMFARNEKVIALLKDAVAANSSYLSLVKKTFFEHPTVQWFIHHSPALCTMAIVALPILLRLREASEVIVQRAPVQHPAMAFVDLVDPWNNLQFAAAPAAAAAA